jgi:hypothetical protein
MVCRWKLLRVIVSISIYGYRSDLFARFDCGLSGRCQTVLFLFCKPRFTQAGGFFFTRSGHVVDLFDCISAAEKPGLQIAEGEFSVFAGFALGHEASIDSFKLKKAGRVSGLSKTLLLRCQYIGGQSGSS